MDVIKTGTQLRLGHSGSTNLDHIPVGVYSLKQDMAGMYLEQTENFSIPDKIYGNETELADRYINTFKETNGNLGIALIGVKGTGKSLLGKLTAARSNLPVILIGDAYGGTGFDDFMTKITQPVVVFIDEFEKTYKQNPEAFLSVLDGVYMGHKMWIFTSNTLQITEYMLNRPGRIHYLKQYDTLDRAVMDEVAKDNLHNQAHSNQLIDMVELSGIASMDVLQALIREMNMYKEDAKTAVQYLNINLEEVRFKVVFLPDKQFLALYSKLDTITSEHPLIDRDVNGYEDPSEQGKTEVQFYETKSGYINVMRDQKPTLTSGSKIVFNGTYVTQDLEYRRQKQLALEPISLMAELDQHATSIKITKNFNATFKEQNAEQLDTVSLGQIRITGRLIYTPMKKSYNKFAW